MSLSEEHHAFVDAATNSSDRSSRAEEASTPSSSRREEPRDVTCARLVMVRGGSRTRVMSISQFFEQIRSS